MIRILYAEVPEQLDYTEYGIDQAIVLDSEVVLKFSMGPRW